MAPGNAMLLNYNSIYYILTTNMRFDNNSRNYFSFNYYPCHRFIVYKIIYLNWWTNNRKYTVQIHINYKFSFNFFFPIRKIHFLQTFASSLESLSSLSNQLINNFINFVPRLLYSLLRSRIDVMHQLIQLFSFLLSTTATLFIFYSI